MSEKLDLTYELVKEMDARQRSKDLADAARHAKEDEWRGYVNEKLEQHSKEHKETRERIDKLEAPGKAYTFLKTKASKAIAGVGSAIGLAYTFYRMFA